MKRLSITLLAIGLSAAVTHAAPGDPRINIDGASCGEARQIVRDTGAAILRYSSRQSDRILYDRFVADSRFCQPSEIARPKTIFRREGACRLLTCQMPDYDDRIWPRRPD